MYNRKSNREKDQIVKRVLNGSAVTNEKFLHLMFTVDALLLFS